MKTSVIVVSYNSGTLLERCLERLLAQEADDEFEIVLVDNASADGSRERVVERFGGERRLRVVCSPVNGGCSGGRNLGLRAARGERVAFVDSDAFAEPGWLQCLMEALDPADVGVAASRSLYYYNPSLLNGLGGTLNRQGYGGDIGMGEPAEFFELPAKAAFASGNGLAVKRAVIDRVGCFDEHYFNYYEDVDLCLRARRAGYQLALAPGAVLHHVQSASDVINRNKAFLCERNRIRTVLKHYPADWLARWLRNERSLDHTRRRALPAGTVKRAWLWNLLHLPSVIRWRLGGGRRLAALDVDGLCEPTWGIPDVKMHNLAFEPHREAVGSSLKMGGDGEEGLLYGWYAVEVRPDGTRYRWSDGLAAVTLRLSHPARALTMDYTWPPGTTAAGGASVYLIHRQADVAFVGQADAGPPFQWLHAEAAVELPPGEVDVLIQSHTPYHADYRRLGLGLSQISLVE